MEYIKFIQDSLLRDAEAYKNAVAATTQDIALLMRKKVNYIAEKVVGIVYPAEHLLDEDDYNYRRFKGKRLKAVSVDSLAYDFWAENAYKGGTLAQVAVTFMQDPDAILADKSLRLTDKEREYVAKFREAFSIKDGCNQTREDIEKSCGDDTTYKLAQLKNKIVMQTTLYWDFTLESMTSEGFLTRGLKAAKTNLWL